MVTGNLKGFVRPLLDSDRWDHDHKFSEAELLVQREDCAQVYVGFPSSSLHFHSKIAGLQNLVLRQSVVQLYIRQVL